MARRIDVGGMRWLAVARLRLAGLLRESVQLRYALS